MFTLLVWGVLGGPVIASTGLYTADQCTRLALEQIERKGVYMAVCRDTGKPGK